jgi:hypothetical protein
LIEEKYSKNADNRQDHGDNFFELLARLAASTFRNSQLCLMSTSIGPANTGLSSKLNKWVEVVLDVNFRGENIASKKSTNPTP